jgi:hypothetical protein
MLRGHYGYYGTAGNQLCRRMDEPGLVPIIHGILMQLLRSTPTSVGCWEHRHVSAHAGSERTDTALIHINACPAVWPYEVAGFTWNHHDRG